MIYYVIMCNLISQTLPWYSTPYRVCFLSGVLKDSIQGSTYSLTDSLIHTKRLNGLNIRGAFVAKRLATYDNRM